MSRSQSYYDEFSATYEAQRHRGYHRLIDDLELEVAGRYCSGRVLEAGCGTGLILERLPLSGAARAQGLPLSGAARAQGLPLSGAARAQGLPLSGAARAQGLPNANITAVGLDLSAGMLGHARSRGLSVSQGSVDAVPFPSGHFDSVVSFKVLAHVPTIERTITELARVTRPGGHLVLEFYNRYSFRRLIKGLKRPSRIGASYTDDDVYTRFDSAKTVASYLPPWLEIVDIRGVRVFTPAAGVYEIPFVRDVFRWAEHKATDHRLLRHLGGFLIVVMRKRDA